MLVWKPGKRTSLSFEDCFQTNSLRKQCRPAQSPFYRCAAIVVAANQAAELFIEGGATAASLLSRLNWISFKPVDELAPGVVRLQLNNKSHLFITLKPGSYSWPEFIFNS
jgi:uncharacterized protein YgbK (DUF1537 family)